MVDDTCVILFRAQIAQKKPCLSRNLNSEVCQRFRALIFLTRNGQSQKIFYKRIDLQEIAKFYHLEREAVALFSEKEQKHFIGQASFSFA